MIGVTCESVLPASSFESAPGPALASLFVSQDIRVLLWAPTESPFGGHVVQLEMTAEHLARLGGVSVSVSRDPEPDWSGIDLVHAFGPSLADVRAARRSGLPVCLSVIYCSKAYRTGEHSPQSRRTIVAGRARTAAALALAAARGRHRDKCEELSGFVIETKALYESADLLLPNSTLEAETLVSDLRVSTPLLVVPNAADPALFPLGPAWQQRSGVICVGRIEPHKNQLALIHALRGTGVRITIVGREHPDHPRYAQAVRAEAGPHVELVGHVAHEELAPHYARARVHVTAAWFETTGLVSLEAALAGCAVVTTEVGYASEYFEGFAEYCNPLDKRSIRAAVLAAHEAPPSPELRRRVLDRYTWKHTAEATLAAYRDLLQERSSR